MNRHRLFNPTSSGGLLGSKRILTPPNNENGTTLLESDFHIHRANANRARSTGPIISNGGSNSLGMNQLSIQMRNLNDSGSSYSSDPMNQISEITDSMYLCGARPIRAPRIRALGISMIFNATVDLPNIQLDKVEFIRIPIEDSPLSNLSVYFDKVADKIDEVSRKGGKCLVHCMAGISRSASLCIAYLMKHERMSLRQAYRRIKSQRPIVHPNPGFFRQLIEYEMKLFGHTTMSIVFNSEPSRQIQAKETNMKYEKATVENFDKVNNYKTYTNITRPLELPVRIVHKYGRQ